MITTLEHLSTILDSLERPIVVTSGGFDPLHVGHVQKILAMKKLGKTVIVIVNGDQFLLNKKGYAFMNEQDRMKIIHSLKGVDYVIPFYDGTTAVTGALKILKPDIFAKGGDRRSPKDIPESDVCKEIGCTMVFHVGGEKIRSSSDIVAKTFK
jgi:cytidyltransferase-like protein